MEFDFLTPRVEVIEITPELATIFLARNFEKNRNVRGKWVNHLARQMELGLFSFTGATIAFNEAGVLIDGQHRLQACVKSTVPFKSVVLFGADAMAYKNTDNNKPKQTNDFFGFDGIPSAAAAAAATRLLVSYDLDHLPKRASDLPFSASELIDFYHTFDGLHDSIRFGISAYLTSGRLMPKAIFSACHYIFKTIDADLADEFIRRLGSGANLGENDPILRLRQKLTQRIQSNLKEPSEIVMAWVIVAWNKWVDEDLLYRPIQFSVKVSKFPKAESGRRVIKNKLKQVA